MYEIFKLTVKVLFWLAIIVSNFVAIVLWKWKVGK